MPIVAAIPAIIGGVTSVVGSVKASKNAKKQTDILQQQTNQQQTLIDQQKKGSELAYSYANEFLPKAKQNLGLVNDYWKKIFSGSRNEVNEALAPEINSYLQNSASVEKNLMNFGNRGNVGDRLIGAEFTKARDLAGARLGLKNQSIGKIQDIGSLLSQLGLNSLASASGQSSNASAILSGQQGITLQQLAGAQQQSAGFGAGLGQLLGAFNWKASSVSDFFGMGKGQSSSNMSMDMFNKLLKGGNLG